MTPYCDTYQYIQYTLLGCVCVQVCVRVLCRRVCMRASVCVQVCYASASVCLWRVPVSAALSDGQRGSWELHGRPNLKPSPQHFSTFPFFNPIQNKANCRCTVCQYHREQITESHKRVKAFVNCVLYSDWRFKSSSANRIHGTQTFKKALNSTSNSCKPLLRVCS
jgi:hypothetical protein